MAPTADVPRHSRLGLDERHDQLVQTGIELFSDRSYDEVSIEEIAAAARISKGLLYHYFPTKREFYVAAIRYAARELQAIIEQDEALPEPERLQRAIRGYLDYVENHAQGYATLILGGISADAEIRAIVDDVRDDVVELVLGGLGAGDEEGPLLRYAIRGWLGLIEQASLDWLDRPDIERDQLLALLALSLPATLTVASRIDPKVKIDVSRLTTGIYGRGT